jgi:rhodanese-related sulfurtransferase
LRPGRMQRETLAWRWSPVLKTVDLLGLRRLLDSGAQLVDVLPASEYAEQHLPGAVSIPLKTLSAGTTAGLDRGRPVVVYCWDGL